MFLPKEINVGYQLRDETYSGKLAYIIYFDEKGVLRKENSWNSWKSKTIPNDIFKNEPTSGFVLNKKAGGYSTGWNYRQSYIRVYDPRGFEFEITVQNLLYILENTNSLKGKGLEGEFVYAWLGSDLVLVPVSSPDYKINKENSDILFNNDTIKAKDLIIGFEYENKDKERVIYLGKMHTYNNVLRGQYKNRNCPITGIESSSIKSLKSEFIFYDIESESFFSKKNISKYILKSLSIKEIDNISEIWSISESVSFLNPMKADIVKIYLTKENIFNKERVANKAYFSTYYNYLTGDNQFLYSRIDYNENPSDIDIENMIEKYKPFYYVSFLENGNIGETTLR